MKKIDEMEFDELELLRKQLYEKYSDLFSEAMQVKDRMDRVEERLKQIKGGKDASV